MRSSESGCPVCLKQQGVKSTGVKSAVPREGGTEMENRTHSADATLVRCPSCGEFAVTEQDYVNLTSDRLRSWNAVHLSALLREQSTRNLPRFWLQDGMAPYGPLERTDLAPIDLQELLARWPRTVPERIDRMLSNLASLSPAGGFRIRLDPNDTALAFAQTPEEARFHINALRYYGWLDGQINVDLSPSDFTITPNGWSRFEALTREISVPENPVFVAMWYGGEDEKAQMDKVFKQGIEPAIVSAGYRATRVDLSEHNDWIMDKVLGDIRIAPFVVAEFTGNRNGVYFEAGFARGLRIPVIHTCREEQLDKAHFDTKQLNHVLWKTAEDLQIKLYHRIVGSIGRGPHPRLSTIEK